ncbi:MAG: serine/threonine-protein kinase [Polyangiaceae bacterium]
MAVQEKATSLGIGSKFGAYEIVSHHGSGGMADIWVARKIATEPPSLPAPEITAERFAIKTLLPRRAHRTDYVERFAQEAELHRRLDHPSVVRMIETDIEDGGRYMALEFVQGLNLRQMIHAAKPRQLPRSVVYEIMARVCDALDYLHDLPGEGGPLGLVHCDVSPENVMIGLDGSVKLIDFGLTTATLATGSSVPNLAVVETSVLRPGRHVPPGRLQYLAPERVDGRSLDRRCDIYSVGSMLFELVHGKRPFQAHATYELLTRICHGKTVDPNPTVDLEARDLIEHAMAVSPENRIDTAKHFADALRLLRDLCDPDEPDVGAVIRRLFGLEEVEEEADAEEIDLLWTEEKATAEYVCLDSFSDTPLLEEGTALDQAIRGLLQQTSRQSFAKIEVVAPEPPEPEIAELSADDVAEIVEGSEAVASTRTGAEFEPIQGGFEDRLDDDHEPSEHEVAERAQPDADSGEYASPSYARPATESSPPEPPSVETRSVPPASLPDLFAPVRRSSPPAVDLFGAYEKRPPTPASGVFLAPRGSNDATPRESNDAAPREKRSDGGNDSRRERGRPFSRAAAEHFEAGWHLLRAGKTSETLTEWETAMQLDPNNRSYAVNVQKLRLKLQR